MVQPAFQKDSRFRISTAVRSRQLDHELILLDLRLGEYFSLNASGASVWSGLERGLDMAALDAELEKLWPVDEAERWRMIEAIVLDFLARGLVERAD